MPDTEDAAQATPMVEIGKMTHIHLAVDEEKAAAIRRCIENGRLTISLENVDLATAGRFSDPYLYD